MSNTMYLMFDCPYCLGDINGHLPKIANSKWLQEHQNQMHTLFTIILGMQHEST